MENGRQSGLIQASGGDSAQFSGSRALHQRQCTSSFEGFFFPCRLFLAALEAASHSSTSRSCETIIHTFVSLRLTMIFTWQRMMWSYLKFVQEFLQHVSRQTKISTTTTASSQRFNYTMSFKLRFSTCLSDMSDEKLPSTCCSNGNTLQSK